MSVRACVRACMCVLFVYERERERRRASSMRTPLLVSSQVVGFEPAVVMR